MHLKYNKLRFVLFAFLSGTLAGCLGGPVVAERKKMPEFTSIGGIEDYNDIGETAHRKGGDFSFAPTSLEMSLNGSTQRFLALQLPDERNDAAAITLINAFKPYALPFIDSWAKQQHQGVMLDLSNKSQGKTYRTDYVLEKTGAYSIPVVVIWDAASNNRLSTLKGLICDMPELRLKKISGNESIK